MSRELRACACEHSRDDLRDSHQYGRRYWTSIPEGVTPRPEVCWCGHQRGTYQERAVDYLQVGEVKDGPTVTTTTENQGYVYLGPIGNCACGHARDLHLQGLMIHGCEVSDCGCVKYRQGVIPPAHPRTKERSLHGHRYWYGTLVPEPAIGTGH